MVYLVEYPESGAIRRVSFNERTDAILWAIRQWSMQVPAIVYSVYKRRLLDRSDVEQILKTGGNLQWANLSNYPEQKSSKT